MITIKSLPYVTGQEVFDQVANHLLTQKTRSIIATKGGYECVYRTTEGLKCAAGCLIGDDEYKPEMEKQRWKKLVEDKLVPDFHRVLILELQLIHDNIHPNKWYEKLEIFAIKCGYEF